VVRNGDLPYIKFIRPLKDICAQRGGPHSCSHVRRLQLLQSKCFRLATGDPRYESNRKVHVDLGVPLFANYIRALTGNFDSKLSDVGTLVRGLLGLPPLRCFL